MTDAVLTGVVIVDAFFIRAALGNEWNIVAGNLDVFEQHVGSHQLYRFNRILGFSVVFRGGRIFIGASIPGQQKKHCA